MIQRKAAAEAFGTFWLVLGGCGTAVFAAGHVGVLGVALAFGLTVVTMAYAIGHISGAHLNPAVSVGAWAAGRMPTEDLPWYVGAQFAGAFLAALVIVIIGISHGHVSFHDMKEGALRGADYFAANGYGKHSPAEYGVVAALLSEIILTFTFLMIILGATDKRAPAGFAGLAIGLALTLIHLIGIPIDNLSVNPARSFGPAVFAGGWALGQLWLFVIAPCIGAFAAGWVYKNFFEKA